MSDEKKPVAVAPQGFEPPTQENFDLELRAVKLRDSGQQNVRDSSNSSAARSTYSVSEETRRLDDFRDTKSAMQYVVLNANFEEDALGLLAEASLNNRLPNGLESIRGLESGTVLLETTDMGMVDITAAAAAVGITAAGIRRTQRDIAADGEVSRPEQKVIIDTINKAKGAVGIN
jgi:hypothetical protein